MYPTSKEMDAVHSGTGVFYQAMPAVGADGKNIMKLIPVKMVNGQFIQNRISMPRMYPAPQKAVTVNISSAPVRMVNSAVLNTAAPQQVFRNQVSFVNAFTQHPTQQQTVNLMAKIPLIATPAANFGDSVKLPCQLPVTVKSPALPRGQYLKIPPNAQVRTVPASQLPPGIKNQILTSSADSSTDSGLHSVVYVSPVTTVNQRVIPPSSSSLHSPNLLSKTSEKTLCEPPAKPSRPLLKLIPKVSQRPNSPIKWVIEEEEISTAPNVNPLDSPSVTSEILQAVAERENMSKHCDAIKQKFPPSSQGKSGQEQENALVVCNGKVFFVAQKCNLPFKMGNSDKPTAATKSYELNKTILPSTQQSLQPAAAQTQKDIRIVIPDESDEVIDLCDDDAQDDSSQRAASVNMSAVSHPDDDNVIFVSYIPPKAEAEPTHDLRLKTQMGVEKETEQTGTSSLDGGGGGDGRDEGSTVTERPGQSISVSTAENVPHVCESAAMNVHDNEGSNRKSQQNSSTQQEDRREAGVETEGPGDPSIPDSITHRVESAANPTPRWASSLTLKPRQMSDHQLRRKFGIAADVKICLQRVDETSAESVPAEPLKREFREPENGLKERQNLHGSRKKRDTDTCSGLDSVKRMKVLTEQEVPGDPATATPHAGITPFKCAVFKLKTKPLSALKECHSGQSSLRGTPCGVGNAPAIGYMEPIDEDFPSTDANDITKPQDTETQHTNARRRGRTRKRTMCLCCIAGTLEPAVKSSARLDEPEKWEWMTEQMSKKGGQTKAPRKDGRTGISCLASKNKQKCETHGLPAGARSPTASTDSDEQKGHKQIRRLKELLKNKEAALELMRHSTS